MNQFILQALQRLNPQQQQGGQLPPQSMGQPGMQQPQDDTLTKSRLLAALVRKMQEAQQMGQDPSQIPGQGMQGPGMYPNRFAGQPPGINRNPFGY